MAVLSRGYCGPLPDHGNSETTRVYSGHALGYLKRLHTPGGKVSHRRKKGRMLGINAIHCQRFHNRSKPRHTE